VAAPPLDLPCNRPVTCPGDSKLLVKTSGRTNFILGIKEQETHLNLLGHDDYIYIKIRLLVHGDYSNISNCWTNIPPIIQGIFTIFCSVSK
jgi:hypothetical protein